MEIERIHSGLPKLGSRLERIAKAFSDSTGATVGFHGGTCATDGSRIILPVKCANLAEDQMDLVWGMLDHEAEHVRVETGAKHAREAGLAPSVNAAIWDVSQRGPRAAMALPAGTIHVIPSKHLQFFASTGHPDLATWLNVVEDVRIERQAGERFEGVRQHLEAGRLDCLKGWQERVATSVVPPLEQLLVAVIFGAFGHDISWVSPQTKTMLRKFRGLIALLEVLDTHHDAINLAVAFADAVRTKGASAPPPPKAAKLPKPPPKPKEEPDEPGPADGDGAGEKEDAPESESGDGGEEDADGPGSCEDSGSESEVSEEPGDGGESEVEGEEDPTADGSEADVPEEQPAATPEADGDSTQDAGQGEGEEAESCDSPVTDDGEGEDGETSEASGDEASEDEDAEGVGDADEDGDEGPGDSTGGGGEDDEPWPEDEPAEPAGEGAAPGGDEAGDVEAGAEIGDAGHGDEPGDVESGDEAGDEGDEVIGIEILEWGDGTTEEPMSLDWSGYIPTMAVESPLEVLKEHLEEMAKEARHTEDTLEVTQWQSPYEVIRHDRVETLEESASGLAELQALRSKHSHTATTLAGRLRTLLLARSQARRLNDQDHGKLDRRALHSLNRPGHIPNRNVFQKTIPGIRQDVAITILVDCSGSMTGAKIAVARQAAALLGDTMVNLEPLGIVWSLVGFTTDYNWMTYHAPDLRAAAVDKSEWDNAYRLEPLVHYRVKSWKDNWRVVAARTAELHASTQNADADSLRWAVRDNLAQKAGRHVVMVLSDGAPCVTGDRRKQYAGLKHAVKEAMSTGVEVQGLGILDASVREFYPVNQTISNVQQLPEAILKMSQGWFNGRKLF